MLDLNLYNLVMSGVQSSDSSKPYQGPPRLSDFSNVNGAHLGLAEEAWRKLAHSQDAFRKGVENN
jgi:hypothetical protein